MRFFLIRHPRPCVASGLCYGRTDLPLSQNPKALAASLAAQLPAGLTVYSSPLQRCTALACQLHPEPILDERVQEINFGDWEMQDWDNIDRAQIDAWAADPLHFAPPHGESVAQLGQRVEHFLREQSTDAIVVTHAGVMKVIAGLVADVPARTWMQYRFPYGSLNIVERSRLYGLRP